MTRPQTEVRDGTIVAGYRVLGVLGVGGSGTVYRAEHLENGSLVALKLLNSEHATNDGERQRFIREAEVVLQLAHPHVVALLEYGFVDDLPFLVFPLLEGRTLEARIAAEGKVGWGLTGRFSEQALSALEVAHGLSIAHRDIKPANIFCHRSETGESIRILDFGTAKIVGPKPAPREEVTRYGALIGTPRYMAPEQVRGETLTPAADVYSFGLVMAEMLLGRPLVTGETDFQMYVEQGSDTPHVLPEEILSSPFAAVIARAVAKRLDVRYRLAGQMLADVRAILARYEAGAASQRHDADLEVTRFFGIAPEAAPVNEGAEKLRKAFNAVAAKAQTAPAPAVSSDPTALPTMVLPAVSDETTSGPTAPVPIPKDAAALDPPTFDPPTLDHPAPSVPDIPVASMPRPERASRAGIALGAFAVVAVGVGVGIALHRTSTSPDTPAAPSSALATGSSAPSATAAGSAAAPVASPARSSPPPSSPPLGAPAGAFTTGPVDRAALKKLLADKAGKQTPELYELALQGMVDCEIPPGAKPTCPAYGGYEATLERPLPKGGAKKRLTIATKYLGHASPSVRILAARIHASAKSDEDFEALLAAAKVEPVPSVLAEMVASMTRSPADIVAFELEALRHADEHVREQAARSLALAADRPDVIDALGKTLASDGSSRVKAAACTGLAGKPAAMPLEPVQKAARDGATEVRTACFAALTAGWVHTLEPRKEAYDATFAILDEKPRNPSRLPEGLGRIAEATLSFATDDTVGKKWLKRATFYDSKRLFALLEDLALDAAAGRALRGAALEALGSVAGKERAVSVRKKLAQMDDEDSKALGTKPKKK